jgi:hypothetical protein
MNQRLANLWRARLEERAFSPLRLSDWCEQNKVTRNQYRYWRSKLKSDDTEPAPVGRWVAVHTTDQSVPAAAARSGIRIHFGGAILEIEPGFHPATLRAVLEAMGAAPC